MALLFLMSVAELQQSEEGVFALPVEKSRQGVSLENWGEHLVCRDESSQEARDAMLKRRKKCFLRVNMGSNLDTEFLLVSYFFFGVMVCFHRGNVKSKMEPSYRKA